jgi:hypothetical protein
MRKRHWSLILATSIAFGGLSVACGDDDDNPANPVDGGGSETSVTPPPPPPPPPGPDGSVPDAADGGCNFATYVKGLIATQTTASALPDTTLGAGCVDNKDQAEFKPLFP